MNNDKVDDWLPIAELVLPNLLSKLIGLKVTYFE